MTRPLEGKTIALAEGRQLEELAALLEAEGATPLRCPLVSILDAPDAAPVEDWLRQLIAGRFDWVVLMTGEAVRRLRGFAERAGLEREYVEALAKARTLTRGPKPVQALKELGLSPTLVADAPTTAGVIETLQREALTGKLVGVTLFGRDNLELEHFLGAAGAGYRPVLSYVYAPAADEERVVELIDRLGRGEVAALLITSAPQVERLFEVAKGRGLEAAVRAGLEKACVAAVGPVAAQALRDRGAPVHLMQERGWVMKKLVRQLARQLGGEGGA
jgi:uroporphyrinogen-III synthase